MKVAAEGAALLGGVLLHAEPVHGGSLSAIARITLADGRVAIVKGGPSPRSEAAMLRAIAAAGAPAPRVLAVDDRVLALEVLPSSGGADSAWGDLGRVLAGLHATRGPRYGWGEDYAFGHVALANAWDDDWPRFWAERRLLASCAHVPADIARRLEALASDLGHRLPARPPPSLLHGDLWGCNILVDSGRVTGLIDPACTYGHAEVDLAMLHLFDQPSPAFWQGYGAAEPGQHDRLPIYQLWPALVHLRLFGPGYRPLVTRLLTAAGV